MADAEYAVTEETFDSLHSYWRNPNFNLKWTSVFVTPVWLRVWWENFGSGREPCLLTVRIEDRLMGVAPLMVENNEAFLMGDPDVCDYMDFVVSGGSAPGFFDAIIRYLKGRDIVRMNLGPIRKDSIAYTRFIKIAEKRNYDVRCRSEDVSYEMMLPNSWEGYLNLLNGKQRHEIRRKFRRLCESSSVDFHRVADRNAETDEMNIFLELFKKNRSEKAAFMTRRMIAYFRSLADAMKANDMMRLFMLKLDDVYAASVLCFDDGSTFYLYNNGYDDRFSALSVGVLSKALTIKYAIRKGKRKYDFLKGDEAYKHHLGGKPVDLFRCRIDLK